MALPWHLAVLFLCVHAAAQPLEKDAQPNWDLLGLNQNPHRKLRKRKRTSGNSRIVGGKPAEAGSYPFLVSLYNLDDPEGFLPVCGGSLITPSVVLTAAHCIADIRSAEIGRLDYTQDEEGVETYTDIEKRFHPNFDASTFDFDYALIKFVDREEPNPFLAALRASTEIPPELKIMGWGLTADEGSQSDILLEATVKRFDQQQCADNYFPDPITDNMFCANERDSIDACQGDSGGPIIIPGTNVQVGIVSWGFECGSASFPGVYARVNQGYSWIEETVCTDLSPDDCTEDGKLPFVDMEGQAIAPICEDKESFIGLGKKMQTRDCKWVGEKASTRCQWYGEDYCPATCAIDRCQEN